LLNKIILFEQLRNNFIIYFSICIISVSFNEVSSICSKVNLEVLSRYCGIEESGAEKDKQWFSPTVSQDWLGMKLHLQQ